jgi:hypothetical protein
MFIRLLDRLRQALGRKIMGGISLDPTLEQRLVALERFWFLADTPMFIDDALVSRLYDAVFRPEIEIASRSDATTSEVTARVAGAGKASVEIQAKIPPILALFGLDVASAKGNVEGSLSGERSKRNAGTGTTTYTAVKSTERYLEKVVSLYAQKYPRRLFWIGNMLDGGHSLNEPARFQTWAEMEDELAKPGPRPLVVLDFEPGAELMPIFGELANGKVCSILIDYLAQRVRDLDNYAFPKYPRSTMSEAEQAATRRAYWQKVHEGFDSQKAMHAIESAAGEEKSRFDWIDFRALVDLDSVKELREPPHLHLVARGEYSTGTFAYQLVRRAARFGVRVVGTLKSGQDINVLAVYER